MDQRGGPKPSPYSLQTTVPEASGYAQIIQGGASRTQQSAPSDKTGSGVELQNMNKSADPYVHRDRDPPPSSEYEKHISEARPKTIHEVVELHEGGHFDNQPQALQTMVKLVTMLNFMKVQISRFLSICVIAMQFDYDYNH